MKKRLLFKGFLISIIATQFIFTGCYSVFEGGTGGSVVDSESTSNPKAGIANVDVYAYTDEKLRDADFDAWTEGTVFVPTAEYYGHTSTGANGAFTISKLVWKDFAPTFGRDADVQNIFMLYYHENYGLTKGSTMIVSDGTADTVYQELTKIRKTTALNISLIDVATDSATAQNVFVKVTVPQTTSSNTSASAKTYDATITGSGTIQISYPRWQSDADKTAGNETSPNITIQYYQSSAEVTWKACANGDGGANKDDYSFLADGFKITKKISNDTYDIKLYGKSTKLSMPLFSGQWGSTSSDNGKVLKLLRSTDDGTSYTVDCGQTTTYAQQIGNNGTLRDGSFSGLGANSYWTDSSYTTKYATAKVRITDGTTNKDLEIRSTDSNITVQK